MPSELSPTDVTAKLAELLELYTFHWTDEDSLQRGIEEALTGAGVEFTREARIASGRIDFIVHADFDIGIEVKIEGAPATVVRQFMRYLNDDAIEGLVVVTSKRAHRRFAGTHVTGKSCEVVWLSRDAS